MRKRTNLLATCTMSGELKCFQSKEEIAQQTRRKEFLRFGGTVDLYLFSMSVKKSIAEFRQGR